MRVFDSQIKEIVNQRSWILICDDFDIYETLEMLKFCFENKILLCRLLSHIFYKLQLCDVKVFASLKIIYRDEIERLYREGLDAVDKEHFTSLYKSARERMIIKRNIRTEWTATDLFSFNSERVFRYISKFSAELTISTVNEVMSFPQD